MENLGTFKIAEPCHADWNEMSPASQGRFCASCQKCVVDFTQKTTAEIKAVYDENAGNVCGRVKASQVVQARPAWHARPKTLRSRALKAVQMFALALLTTFGFMLHSEVHAQEREIMGKVAYVPELQQQTEVFGRVMLDTGAPAARASVLLLRDGNTVAERELLLGISLPLPLFNREQGSVAAALSREQAATLALQLAEQNARTSLQQTHARWQALNAQAQILQADALPAAQSAYRAASLGFEYGKFSFLEVLDAQRSYFGVQSQYLRTLLALHRTAAEWQGQVAPAASAAAAAAAVDILK